MSRRRVPLADEITAAEAKRHRARLYVAALLVDAMAYAYHVLVPVHAQKEFAARPEELGYLGATATGVYAVVCFLSGRWSDRVGSAKLYHSGLGLLVLVVFPLVFWARNLEQLYVANILLGVAVGLFWPPIERQLALLSAGDTLWRAVGTFNCFWAAGIACGSLGGPNLYGFVSLDGGIGFCLCLMLGASFLLLRGFPAARAAEGSRSTSVEAPANPRRALFLHLAWVANFAALFAYQGVIFLLPYVSEALRFSLPRLGILLFSINAARLLAFFVLRQVRGWHYSLFWLVVLQLAGGGSLLFLGFERSPLAFHVLLPFLGAFVGLSYFSSLYYGLSHGSEEGKKSGFHEGILALGMTFGPLLCGWAGKAFPDQPGAVIVPAAVVLLGALAVELSVVVFSRSKRRSPAVE